MEHVELIADEPAGPDLLGREKEVSQIAAIMEAALVDTGQSRVLGIAGPWGTGKTFLAMMAAHRLEGAQVAWFRPGLYKDDEEALEDLLRATWSGLVIQGALRRRLKVKSRIWRHRFTPLRGARATIRQAAIVLLRLALFILIPAVIVAVLVPSARAVAASVVAAIGGSAAATILLRQAVSPAINVDPGSFFRALRATSTSSLDHSLQEFAWISRQALSLGQPLVVLVDPLDDGLAEHISHLVEALRMVDRRDMPIVFVATFELETVRTAVRARFLGPGSPASPSVADDLVAMADRYVDRALTRFDLDQLPAVLTQEWLAAKLELAPSKLDNTAQ